MYPSFKRWEATGNRLVDSNLKQYTSRTVFSSVATTRKGNLAITLKMEGVKMFDRLGIRVKTAMPALGEAITRLDVSADRHWIPAICLIYLLLIDVTQKEGKDEGRLGFEVAFSKDSKRQLRRLRLSPQHVAQFRYTYSMHDHFREWPSR